MAQQGSVRAFDRAAFYGARYLGQAGQGLFLAALFLAAGTGKDGPLGLSGIFAATLAAGVLFGLPGGALADALGPGRGYALGAVLRLGAIAATPAVVGSPAYIWTAAFAYSMVSQLFTPAEMALVPVVQRGASSRAHALLVGMQYAGQATGMALLAPLLMLRGGPHAMLLAATGIYAALSVLTGVLALRLSGGRGGGRPASRDVFAFGTTLRFLTSEPRATYAVGLLTFSEIAIKSLIMAVPLFVKHELGLSGREVAYLAALGAGGALLGLLWSGRRLTLPAAHQAMRFALIGTVASVLALVTLSQGLQELAEHSRVALLVALGESPRTAFVVAAPLALVLGLCFSIAPIGARAVLTDTAPAGQQARVFASQTTLSHAAVILPLVLAGAGTQLAGPETTLLFIGTIGALLVLALEAVHLRRAVPIPFPVPVPVPLVSAE